MSTVSEKLLLAARAITEAGARRFTFESLVVAAWESDPETFGLRGYTDRFPDSHKVRYVVDGKIGLVGRGQLLRTGPNEYELGQGLPPERQALAKPVRLNLRCEPCLIRLLESQAWSLAREGRTSEITVGDSFRFWGLSEQTIGTGVHDQLDQVSEALAEALSAAKGGPLILGDGRQLERGECEAIVGLNERLYERFRRHLSVLASRPPRVLAGGKGVKA